MQKANALSIEAAQNLEKCWDAQRECYTQAIGSPNLDASTLKLITMNYLPYDDARAKKHIVELEKSYWLSMAFSIVTSIMMILVCLKQLSLYALFGMLMRWPV
jgi:hypothetical protein